MPRHASTDEAGGSACGSSVVLPSLVPSVRIQYSNGSRDESEEWEDNIMMIHRGALK